MHLNGKTLTAEHIRDAARIGDVFASNGPFLILSVDGIPMGSVCPYVCRQDSIEFVWRHIHFPGAVFL